MSKKEKTKFRYNNYDANDAGIMFLLALVLPQFLMALALLICSYATGLSFVATEEGQQTFMDVYPTIYTLICALVPQISMLLGFFFVSERKKVNYVKANQIHFKKLNWLLLLIVLSVGIICMLGFSPFVSWFDGLVAKWGYTSSVSNIDVSSVGKLFGTFFYVALVPAICEELVFRGVITNGIKQHGLKTAVLLSAVLFALMHLNLQQFFYQLFLGGVMAYIVLKTGNILYTMLLHFFNNFVILLNNHINGEVGLTFDYSNAWHNIWPILLVILTVAIVVGLLFLMNYVLKKQSDKNKCQCENPISSDSNTQKSEKNYSPKAIFKNPYFVTALVAGILLWIFSIVTNFVG